MAHLMFKPSMDIVNFKFLSFNLISLLLISIYLPSNFAAYLIQKKKKFTCLPKSFTISNQNNDCSFASNTMADNL